MEYFFKSKGGPTYAGSRTHLYQSGMALEKLVSGGAPVPLVASYGMTSGFTPPQGITAPMLYSDPAQPPSAAQNARKILVFQTAPYPDPPYSNSFLDNFTLTDYEWRSPGNWPRAERVGVRPRVAGLADRTRPRLFDTSVGGVTPAEYCH